MQVLQVNQHSIGPGHPCFLVAEIGINHNGDPDLARRLIDAAAASGADAVKFQNYHTEDFIADRDLTYEYLSEGQRVVESQVELFKRCELSAGLVKELAAHAARARITFFTTPTSEETLQDALAAGVPLLKNGSDFLTHLPMIRRMAQTGLPTVLSTGMATLAEIDEAVRAFREAGGRDLLLLHCTSSYPTPPEDAHLRKIQTLAGAFGCPAGLSDHTEGIVAAVGAVALGAVFIEKHFTLDRHLPGPDQWFSSDPAEFRALVNAVRTMEKSLGQSAIAPTAGELKARAEFRLSCVAASDLPAGRQVTTADVVFRRPGRGLPPQALSWMAGRSLRQPVAKGALLLPEHFA